MNKTTLSVVVPTYNEERNIAECIDSAQWADEILIVDAQSTDGTVEICKQAGVKVLPFLNPIRHPESQRTLGMREAKHDWVLCLDADERPSIPLAEEIRLTLDSNPSHHGFEIPFQHFFFGQHMRHGGLAKNYLLRLVRRDSAYYPLGGVVHEQLHVKGTTSRLRNPILHYGTRDLTHYFEKSNFYTSLTAQKLYHQGVRVNYTNAVTCFAVKPIYYFLKRYLIQEGFLDGKYGLILALLTAMTVVVNHLKLFELQKKNKGDLRPTDVGQDSFLNEKQKNID
jgi:glycosyltransferase involved in cell wall biosynthesis